LRPHLRSPRFPYTTLFRSEVAAGRFRQDLYYRLNVVTIHLPRLAERRGDVAPLARHFAARLARRLARPVVLSDEAVAWLEQQEWPGNVRELEHAIERAAVLSEKELLEPGEFVLGLRTHRPVPPLRIAERGPGGEDLEGGSGGELSLRAAVEAAERAAIEAALAAVGGNRR